MRQEAGAEMEAQVSMEAMALNKGLMERKELVGAIQERGFWMERTTGSPQRERLCVTKEQQGS